MSEPAAVTPAAARTLEEDLAAHARSVEGSERLQQYLAQCKGQGLFERYEDADRKAQRLQIWHRRVTAASVSLAVLALLLGIAQLAWHENLQPWAVWVELGLIAGAAALMLAGYVLEQQEGWLLWRYKAERYRQLVFQIMIDPKVWRSKPPTAQEWSSTFEAAINEIDLLKKSDLKTEACEEPMPPVAAGQGWEGKADAVKPLVKFYRDARLRSQKNYFKDKVHRDETRWFFTNPRLVPIAFLLSVFAVVLHVAFEESGREAASRACLVISAWIPAVLMGYKTWRSANEYSRNASRAKAKLKALDGYDRALQSAPASRVFDLLVLSEGVLVSEQREWLRLMVEAEWI